MDVPDRHNETEWLEEKNQSGGDSYSEIQWAWSVLGQRNQMLLELDLSIE